MRTQLSVTAEHAGYFHAQTDAERNSVDFGLILDLEEEVARVTERFGTRCIEDIQYLIIFRNVCKLRFAAKMMSEATWIANDALSRPIEIGRDEIVERV